MKKIKLLATICFAVILTSSYRMEAQLSQSEDKPETSIHERRAQQPAKFRKGGDVFQRMQHFKEANPEQYEELMQLREKDPQAFRERMRDVMRQQLAGRDGEKNRMRELSERQRDLARQYQEAEDPERKEQIRTELREVVEKAFDERVEYHRDRLERMEKEIERLKDHIKQRVSLKDEIVERRISELTEKSMLDWNGNW